MIETVRITPAAARDVGAATVTSAAANQPPTGNPVVDQLLEVQPARRSRWIIGWFLLAVALPFAASWAYFALVATPQYGSSFRFVIHGAAASSVSASSEGEMSMAAAAASHNVMVASFMISDYTVSPQVVADLSEELDLREMFSGPEIDLLSRLREDATPDDIAKYWQRRVITDFDMMTGLTTVTIHAFTPEDAHTLAETVMRLSEILVNSIGDRPRQDKLNFLTSQVKIDTERLAEARARVREFRVRHLSIDPSSGAGMTDSLVGKLTDQYVSVTTQLAALRGQLGPEAPSILRLAEQARAISEEIELARSQVGAGFGQDGTDAGSYAAQLQDYEDLQLDLTIATKNYQSAESALLAARKQASEKQYYVLTYVLPAIALYPDAPNIPESMTIIFLVLLAFWLISMLIAQSIRDHM